MRLNKNHSHVIRMVLRAAGVNGQKSEKVLGYISCEECTRDKLKELLIKRLEIEGALAKNLSETLLPE